jgi:hypothetical protein
VDGKCLALTPRPMRPAGGITVAPQLTCQGAASLYRVLDAGTEGPRIVALVPGAPTCGSLAAHAAHPPSPPRCARACGVRGVSGF